MSEIGISRGVKVDLTKTVSFILATLALCGVLVGGVTWVNSYAFRIEVLETKNAQLLDNIATLTQSINQLDDKIVDLTIALNRVQDRNESTPKVP